VVKTASCKEVEEELTDCATSQEDRVCEANISPPKIDAVCRDVDADSSGTASWPDFVDYKAADLLIERGPLQRLSSDFSEEFCTRNLPKGQNIQINCFVCSKEPDVFFFCKLCDSKPTGKVAKESNSDFKKPKGRVRPHEISNAHILNSTECIEVKSKLSKINTVDDNALKMVNKKKKHWQGSLTRVIIVVQYLPEHFLGFRGKSAGLYEKGSGNFLVLTEMLAKSDPTVQECVRRIASEEIHDRFLI
jgi:hypothetical protein